MEKSTRQDSKVLTEEELQEQIVADEQSSDSGNSRKSDRETRVNGDDLVGEGPVVDEIESLTLQLSRSKDEYLRLAAEFDNYKKRTAREFANLIKSANEDLIVGLLEILDNFERAFKSREENSDAEAYHKGMKLVYNKLLENLNRQGLRRFDSVGQKFDPRLHEAIMQTDSDELAPDTIVLELQPGYTLNDKVIRHARVSVAVPKDGS